MRRSSVVLLVAILALGAQAQTVIYEDNFDDYAEARVPDHWSRDQSNAHVDQADVEVAIWGAVNYEAFTAWDDGYDANRLDHLDDPTSHHAGAYWKEAPGADFSQVGPNNRILAADTVIHSSDTDAWMISDSFSVSGFQYVVFQMESHFLANQDQQAWFQYRMDGSGSWKRAMLLNDILYRNDQNYYGPFAFTFDAEGHQSIQFRFQIQGTWSWLWTLDKFKLTGYNSVPPGPGKPDAVSPMGSIPHMDTALKSSPYSGDGDHVFSQWQIRLSNGTYGEMLDGVFDDEEIAWVESDPILDTGMQPTTLSEETGSYLIYDLQGDQTEFALPKNILRPGKTFSWRVRHWNNLGQAGPWSDEAQISVDTMGGIALLDENFDDVFDGEVPDGWTFEFTGEPPQFNDGYMTAADATRPKHRWTDSVNDSADELWGDGSGRHGGFSGRLMWAAWKGDLSNARVFTPPFDFSNASAGALIFDSNLKSNAPVFISVALEGQDPVEVFSMRGWEDDAVRITTETIIVPEVAGQSNARFVFHTADSARWTFDNVRVVALTDLNLPEQPVAIGPEGDVPYTGGTAELTATAFNDPDAQGHASSRWQLALAATGFSNPLVDVTVTEGNLTMLSVRDIIPTYSYVWRVKYIATDGRESGWSLPARFDVQPPEGGTILLSEGFDGLSGQTPPEGWTHVNNNIPGGNPEYDGWTYIGVDDWVALFAQERDQHPFVPGTTIALADSDEYQGAEQGFNSELITPTISNPSGDPVILILTSSYRHYDEQIGEINYSFDGGSTWQNLIRWDASEYADNEFAEAAVGMLIPDAETASEFQIMFKLYGSAGPEGIHSNNDWWWAIDDVLVMTAPGAEPVVDLPPVAPNPLAPTGVVAYGDDIQLSASAYSHPGDIAQTAARWQVSRAYKNFEPPLFDQEVTEGDLTSIDIGALAPGHDYVWRVRYTAANEADSEWSVPATFTVQKPDDWNVILFENFDAQSDQDNPPGWSQINNNDPDGFPEFNGWSFLTLEFFNSYGQGRQNSPHFDGRLADADSDEYEQSGVGSFNSALLTPALDTGGRAMILQFDTWYQHYSNQIAEVNVSLDNGANWDNLIKYDASTHADNAVENVPVIVEIPAAGSSSQVKIMWWLYGNEGSDGTKALNGWFWAIDNVFIYGAGGVDVDNWMIH